jgi:hypothetical protein
MTLKERIEKFRKVIESNEGETLDLFPLLDVLSDMAAKLDGAVSCDEPEPVKPKTRGREVADGLIRVWGSNVYIELRDRTDPLEAMMLKSGLSPEDAESKADAIRASIAAVIDAEIARAREACAELAYTWAEWTEKSYTVSDEIAAAIRARGQVTS